MLMAFIWWAILLYGKNQQVFQAKKQLLELKTEFRNDSNFKNRTALELEAIYSERERQNRMVFGEVLVFCLALIFGLYLINRAHNREMQAANQQKNFLLSITHELKSPIASIKLAMETFLRRELKPEQIQKLSLGALTETNRLDELVKDILLSARLESAYDPQFELTDIQEFTKKTCSDFSKKHPEIDLNCSFENDLPNIEIDQQGLQIIISNLLENSLKYNFSKSKKIDFKIFQKGNYLSFKIADNGSGITDFDKKKVFEKFYRSGNEETRKTKGTGLGLYIVNEIVKSHAGKISIKDNQPQGTVFFIDLPITK